MKRDPASMRTITALIRGSLTPEERAAIESLRRALAKMPAHLDLFGWTGTLCVVRKCDNDDEGIRPLVQFGGIHCDGGDPNDAGKPKATAGERAP